MTTQLYSKLMASSLASGLIAFGYSVPEQNLYTESTLAINTPANQIHQAASETSMNQMSAYQVRAEFILDGGLPERLVIAGSR
ncbi:hypothetical protein [Nostoc sp. PCC 7107]|uniref:hypothetical protein n=1 Tax=Nostoc sp. PCC 7107 TaxID=317936 RepID=UPI00029F4578|nr:hypothetical protein [Nostoc sp. PCC 7107]AFY41520.1 tetratricopeptide TPR_2 [Nostoc sp. PCC 7107]